MRLIDADAIDYDEYWNRNGEGFTIDVCQKAQRIIDEQPTIPSAEAVQVVRCKDCRYDLCESLGDDGFCSWGERKGGGDE